MTESFANETTDIYYGWKIVAAIMFILTFASGLSFYNHPVYLNELASRDDFDLGTASFAVSLFFLSGGVSGLVVGKWVERVDPRYCISFGALISAVALSCIAYVETVGQLYVVYIFFGAGFSASSLIPATTIVARWFRKKRAMALSIASTGLSLGGVILTPLTIMLVDELGFKTVAPMMGFLYLAGVIPVAWIWLRKSPESMGLKVDGGLLDKEEADSGAEDDGLSFAAVRRMKNFWGISTGYIFLMMAQVGGIAHQYGLSRELLSEEETAIAVAILPITSIIGRLAGGWVIDRMSIRVFAICIMILQVLSLCMLGFGASIFTLCVGLAFFGATVGNLLMLQPLLIADAFGLKDYSRIFSMANLMSSCGTAVGPALLGYFAVINAGDYTWPYAIAAAAGAIGLVLFLLGGRGSFDLVEQGKSPVK